MERDKSENEADMVESAGETTAAATGSSEIGAAKGEEDAEGSSAERPVGADTRVKVAGETENKD
jgi:hypothetical protein